MTTFLRSATSTSGSVIDPAVGDGTLSLMVGNNPASQVTALSFAADGTPTFNKSFASGYLGVSGPINVNTTLLASDLGKNYYIYGTPTITLPIIAASDVGKTFTFYGHGNGPYTIAAGVGGNIYAGGNVSGSSTISLGLGDSITLVAFGAPSVWMTAQEAHCIGVGQSWQNPTRSAGTTYTNSTGKPIGVSAYLTPTANPASVTLTINSVVINTFNLNTVNAVGCTLPLFGIVPSGHTYVINATNATLTAWTELR